jgi:hypothetical protein
MYFPWCMSFRGLCPYLMPCQAFRNMLFSCILEGFPFPDVRDNLFGIWRASFSSATRGCAVPLCHETHFVNIHCRLHIISLYSSRKITVGWDMMPCNCYRRFGVAFVFACTGLHTIPPKPQHTPSHFLAKTMPNPLFPYIIQQMLPATYSSSTTLEIGAAIC